MGSPLTNRQTTRRKFPVQGMYVQRIMNRHIHYVSRIVVVVIVITLTKKKIIIILYRVRHFAIVRKKKTFISGGSYRKTDKI